jgi:hypothetical protein
LMHRTRELKNENNPFISGQIEPVFRWQRQMNTVIGVGSSGKAGKVLLFLMQRVHLQKTIWAQTMKVPKIYREA